MSAMVLELRSPGAGERVEGVHSFVAEDASGSFGLLPGHARFMTVLEPGLARFRTDNGAWQYIALPGAVLNLAADQLVLATRYYVRGDDYARITRLLDEALAREFDDALARLGEQARRARTGTLLAAARERALTADEKSELQTLMSAR